MAGNPIFHEDIAKVKELQKSIIDFIPVLIQMREQVQASAKANLEHAKSMSMDKEAIIGLAKVTDELKVQNVQITKAIKDTTEASKKFSEAEKAAAELDKQRSRDKAKYLSDLAKQEAKQRDMIKTAEMEAKSIDELAKKTSAMIALRKQMTDITGKNKDAFDKLSKSINDNQNKLKEYDSQIGNHQRNVGNYVETINIASMSLGEMKKAFTELKNISFSGKSEAEIQALKQKIGDLKDAMGDMQTEMQMMGTEKSAVLVSGLKFVAAGVEGIVGSLSLFGVQSEVIQSLEKKMTSLIAVTQALSAIEDTVTSGKLRAIAIRIESMALDVKDTVVKWANATATTAQGEAEAARATMTSGATLATKAAAAAQWLWNAALSANPIGLAVIAIAALAAGIAYVAKKMYDHNTVGKVTEKIVLDIAAAQREYNKAVSETSKSYDEKLYALKDVSEKEKAIHKENADYYMALEAMSTAFTLKMQKLRSLETLSPDERNKLLEQATKLHHLNIENLTNRHFQVVGLISKKFNDEEKKLATDREKNIKPREEAEKAFYDFKVKYGMASLEEQQAHEIAELQKMDEYKKASIQQQGEAEAAIRAKFIALSILEEEKKNQAIKESNDRLIASQASEKKNKGESIDKGTSASLSGVVSSATARRGTELSDLQDLYAQKLIAAEEYKRREKEINEKYDQQILEKSIEVIKQSIAAKRAASLDTEKDEKELAGIEIELAEFVRLKKKENIQKNMDDEQEEWNKKLAVVKQFASAAQDILGALSDWYKQDAQNQLDTVQEKYDSDLTSLDRQLAGKTISEEKYTKEKIKLDAKRKQDELKIQKEAAEKQKTIQTIQAVINTALAVTGALSTQPVWLGIVMALLVGAMGAVEIATIQSAKFAQGGHGLLLDKSKGGILKGNSHSKGGISLGDIGEAEGGEYFGIVNKSATEKYRNTLPILFDAINQGKFENMFARQGSNVVVNVNDKYGKEMLAEMKQTKSQTVTMDMGDYVLYQTGNYTLKVRKS